MQPLQTVSKLSNFLLKIWKLWTHCNLWSTNRAIRNERLSIQPRNGEYNRSRIEANMDEMLLLLYGFLYSNFQR